MERVLVTGATGFVGGNVAAELVAAGVEVLCAVRRDPGPSFPWPWRITDLGSTDDIGAALGELGASWVVHLAIDGAFDQLVAHRRSGFDGYVGMTRRIVDAANASGARVAYISTDWVFDGTGHLVDEDEPVCPVNLYGVFKALSERVVLDRAEHGLVARVGAVQARNLARPDMPWDQSCGFGNLALAAVDALAVGREFTVWQHGFINSIASPVTAAEIGIRLTAAMGRHADGVVHLVGADALARTDLVRLTCEVFDLDPGLVRTGPVPPGQMLDERMPFDTSLSSPRTDELVGACARGFKDQLLDLRASLGM